MSQTHTIVVCYPDGARPEYFAQCQFQGGRVVAVHFDGNRLEINQVLEEALEQAVTSMLDSGYSTNSVVVRAAMDALKKSRRAMS